MAKISETLSADNRTKAIAMSARDVAGYAGDPDFMASLARGLLVIQAFSEHRSLLSVSQISHLTEIPRAAVRRCLYTLEKLGFVHSPDGRCYALMPRSILLGHAYLASAPISRLGESVLQRLNKPLNESSSVCVLDGDNVLFVARAPTKRLKSTHLDVGSRLPAVYTSMGRVLIAFLPDEERRKYLAGAKLVEYTIYSMTDANELASELERIRSQGYSILDQELELGVRSVAVPIVSRDGRAMAAVAIGVHAQRISIEEIKQRFVPILQEAAQELALLQNQN